MMPPLPKYIEVANGRKIVRVFLDEIASVVTDAHYLDITLSSGEKQRCRMTIPEFFDLTGRDPRFLPVNKGIMANADYILEFEDNCCIIEDGTRFPVRVRERLKIERAARDYHFGKIRERHAHFAGRQTLEDTRKGDLP